MSTWNYVVTAHKPTNVTHSCVGNFTAPQELNLIIAKCTRIEIHLLTAQGLQPLLDVPIYVRIATLELFRPHGETRDLLFIVTERYKFCVLQWDPETSELVTRAMRDVSDRIGRPTDSGQIGIIDPDCRLIGLHLYDGLFKVIPFDNKALLKEAFNIRLKELQVLDIKFLYGCSKPTIVFLYQDNKDARHVKTSEVSLKEKDFVEGPWSHSQSNFDNCAGILIPVPPLCGVLIIGEETIVYGSANAFKAIPVKPSITKAYGRVDADGSKCLLGDYSGLLHLLVITCEKDNLAIAKEGERTIGTTGDIQRLHIRSILLGEQARHICHQEQSRTCAICSVKYGQSGGVDSEMNLIRLLDDQTVDIVSTYPLDTFVNGCSILSCSFSDDSGVYYCVGTAYVLPEESEPTKGQILVFTVENGKLQFIAEKETKGAVYSLNSFNGKLLAAINQKIQFNKWRLRDDGSLELQGDFIVIRDKSISLLIDKGNANHLSSTFETNLTTKLSHIGVKLKASNAGKCKVGKRRPKRYSIKRTQHKRLPRTYQVNHRYKSYMTGIEDQQDYAICYAVALCDLIKILYRMVYNYRIVLSPQPMIDYGDKTAKRGARIHKVLEQTMKVGLPTRRSYSYVGPTCKWNTYKVYVSPDDDEDRRGDDDVDRRDDDNVDSTDDDDGHEDDDEEEDEVEGLHAMVIGACTIRKNGIATPCWEVKNSGGKNYCDDGFALIARDQALCPIYELIKIEIKPPKYL